jgi:hypothetical protein
MGKGGHRGLTMRPAPWEKERYKKEVRKRNEERQLEKRKQQEAAAAKRQKTEDTPMVEEEEEDDEVCPLLKALSLQFMSSPVPS